MAEKLSLEYLVLFSHSFALTMIPLLTMEFPLNLSVFFFCKLISTPFLDQLLRIRYQLVDYAKFENSCVHICPL